MKLSLAASKPGQKLCIKPGVSSNNTATTGITSAARPINGSSSIRLGGLSAAAKGKGPAFKAFDDEDDQDPATAGVASAPAKGRKAGIDPSRVGTSSLSRNLQKTHAQALEIDPSVFAYDEVYDGMKAAETAAVEARKSVKEGDKPKYVSGLLQAADLRKKDRIRAEDKLIEREREKEGDEFAGKDKYVTQAYKDQQAELRKAEEEERLREEREAKKPGGMAAYYQDELARKEAIHSAAMAAASNAPINGASTSAAEDNLRARGPKSEAQIAAEASIELGRHVQVNDSGEIVDKRELLTGGLNVKSRQKLGPASGPPKGFGLSISERKKLADEEQATREKERKEREDAASLGMTGLTMAQRQQMSRQRQSEEMQRQLLEHQERKRKQEDESQGQAVKKVAKRNNDESKIEELKRKALERRLAKQEQDKQTQIHSGQTNSM